MSDELEAGAPMNDDAEAVAAPSGEVAVAADGEAGGRRRIGVYICHCGGNISDYVDVQAVADAVKDDADVVVATTTMFACSDGTQKDMIHDIQQKKLDGLVVASCSPKLHQTTFRNVSKRADLNPYAYTQVNVREQASWAHTDDFAGATEKVIGLVKAGIGKTALSEPLEPLVVKTQAKVMVVGGGIAGLRAAIGLADVGLGVFVVEREPELGGWVGRFGPMFPYDHDGRAQIAELKAEVARRPGITVWTSSQLTGKSGSFGNYVAEVTVTKADGSTEVIPTEVGAIVVATGFDSYEPEVGELGYGIDGVLTLPEYKELIDGTPSGPLMYHGKRVRTVAYVYCVGNRQPAPGNEYCSKFCCTAALHSSLEVHKVDPSIKQYHLYRDIRAYGKNELTYTASRKAGSVFMKFADDNPPAVARTDAGLAGDDQGHPHRWGRGHHPGRPARSRHRHGGAAEPRADRPAQAAARQRRLLQRDPPQAAARGDHGRRGDDRRHLPGAEDRAGERGLRARRRRAERGLAQEGLRRARPTRRHRPRERLHGLRRVPRQLSVRRDHDVRLRRGPQGHHLRGRVQGLRWLCPVLPRGRDRPPRIHRCPDEGRDRRSGEGTSGMNTALRDTREIIREEPLMHAPILAALADGPLTIPEIAERIGKPSDEVVFWVMGMRRYGHLAEVPDTGDEGYFQYRAVNQEATS